ncbi:hypothetical protein LJC46_00895 [Desulfovibrio sp. OttesenSCG-928-G15]|nr:hypothetical protein [Desulfovibrio sp. OttesenSCG-928-G15]
MSTLNSNLASLLGSNSELFRRILEEGAESGLLEQLMAPKQRNGRQMMAEALTGRLRSDAGALTQSSKNANEGKTIADLLETSANGVSEALKSMSTVAGRIAQNGVATDADKQEYNAALDSLKATIKNSSYNGISLMDGKAWPSDERLSVNGNTARLGIQMGAYSRNIILHDFSSMGDLDNAETAFADPADAQTVQNAIDALTTKSEQYAKSYKGVAAGFESSAKTLERQSQIMDRAAKRSIYGAQDDPAGKLLSYLLSEQGNIISRSS